MGYDVHITRGGDWWADDCERISDETWIAVVDADPELSLTDVAEEASAPGGQVLRYSNPLLAVWTQPGTRRDVWFDFREGSVVVRNPDDAVLAKLRILASAMRARVQGDEGEFYD